MSPIRLIDVSPGPMCFNELRSTQSLQKRAAFTTQQYFTRLDRFVALYGDGHPPPDLAPSPLRSVVIPLGVDEPDTVETDALPTDIDPRYAIGACCRIVPAKRIEFLIEMMARLAPRLPKATLTIVGSLDPRHVDYWNRIVDRMDELGVTSIRFVGGHANVWPYLKSFRVFVMISDDQGCPNASLEAMAAGLPIVANPSGGTGEQIEDGRNGYLVSDVDPGEAADRVEHLLRNARIREAFGRASRKIARERFSMAQMVERYLEILDP